MGRKKINEMSVVENGRIDQICSVLKKDLDETEKKINDGLSKRTASTGTNIDDLYGGAKFMSQLSNIGGGSKAIGGGGVEEGFNIVNKSTAIKAQLGVVENAKRDSGSWLIDTDRDK